MSAEFGGRCETCRSPLSPDGTCPICLIDLALEPPTESFAPAQPPPASRDRIGPYRILRLLGEGGMGIVYLAEQNAPIRRRVALKLIKPGMDSGQVIARFESERQALALMSHPHVARVFDAGVSDDGRPYFVMEYVEGVAITAYCDQHRLPIPDRLDLFMQACDALQHAHQKGLIHRDLKPSNILVCREGERASVKIIDFGVAKATNQKDLIHRDLKPSNILVCREGERASVKIIDFGVAKATNQKLTERTLYTELGVAIGTPEYMSPEQAGITALDVDTRADIYSLGVVLYELLVGALPFDPRELRAVAGMEMLRIIREVDPPSPSTRIHRLGKTGEEVARHRMTDLPTLARILSGELEWITLKALEKDPARRYSSASEFAADLHRYLTNEPVLARPQTVWYRTRKFVRRHRLPVAAAAAVLLALIAGLVASTVLYVQATAARDRARREADKAKAINDFMQETLGSPEPGKLGRQVLVVDVLQRAASKIDDSFANQPDIRSTLHGTIGEVLFQLGMMNPAEAEFLKVLDFERRTLGDDARATIETGLRIGRLRWEAHRYEEAIRDFSAVLEHARRSLGPEDTDTIDAMHLLGNVDNLAGRQKEAEPLLLEALRLHERIDGPDHFLTATNHMSVAQLYSYSQRLDQSEEHWRRAIAILDRRGESLWLLMRAQGELADIYTREGRLDLAEPLARRTLEDCRRELGEMHAQTARAAGMVVNLDLELGKFDEAERIAREQLAQHQSADLGDRTLPVAYQRLANVLAREGKDEAKEMAALAVNEMKKAYGEPHLFVADALRTQGNALYRVRHPDFDGAKAAFQASIDMFRGLFGEDHPYVAGALKDLALMEHTRGDHAKAAALFAEALQIFENLGFEAPWPKFELKARMGGCLVEAGRYSEAEGPLEQGYEFLRSHRGETDPLTLEALRSRVTLLEATHRQAEATSLRLRLPDSGSPPAAHGARAGAAQKSSPKE